MNTSVSDMATQEAISHIEKLTQGLESVIKGRTDTIQLVLAALCADGHALLEDYPGSGKTTLAKTLGRLISKDSEESREEIIPFRRIQFTPDMLPGDVLGVNIFDANTSDFRFLHGPVFAHIVLADEINRTGPKVQAAFLECMAEKQVTIDNQTHPLHSLFFVLGTQNPLDLAGTYPLPLVQLDRFLLKIPMSYVDKATELEILENHTTIKENVTTIEPVCSVEDILTVRRVVSGVHIEKKLLETIVNILEETRKTSLLEFGVSTRAGLMLQSVLKAWALIQKRDYCTEDDLKFILPYVLLHRLRFRSTAQSPVQMLEEMIKNHLDGLIASGVS